MTRTPWLLLHQSLRKSEITGEKQTVHRYWTLLELKRSKIYVAQAL